VLSDGSVVTGGRDGRVRLWRTDQPGVPMALSADDDDQMDKLVTTVHMLPDGHVVTYDVDGVIRLWRTDEPGVPLQVGTQDEDVSVLALSDGLRRNCCFSAGGVGGLRPGGIVRRLAWWDPSLTPIVFDHLAIAEPESVGESVGREWIQSFNCQ
jgi:hypothetical protein